MFRAIYRDRHLLVLDKPAGLLSVPGRGPDLQDCLSARVQKAFPGALVVHRLDRDTSGLIAMALTVEAQRELGRQFAERVVQKRYVAVVWGRPAATGAIRLPLRKDPDRPPRHMVDPQFGKPAQTDWNVVESDGRRSRLEVRPVTGRSHQIRVHLAALGHPVLGDPLYAHPLAQTAAPRLLLHAERLALVHPADGTLRVWTSVCPF